MSIKSPVLERVREAVVGNWYETPNIARSTIYKATGVYWHSGTQQWQVHREYPLYDFAGTKVADSAPPRDLVNVLLEDRDVPMAQVRRIMLLVKKAQNSSQKAQ